MASSNTGAWPLPPLYQPLNKDKREIRLLEILPNTPDGKVNCKLHTVTPDVYYTCLSYVWGDPNITEEIIVDGVSRQVTVTLATALRHVKKHWINIESKSDPDLDTSKFRLWADALCINQKDLTERLHQVDMMADIYSSAVMVLAWLSSKDEDAGEAFGIFEKILQIQPQNTTPQEGLFSLREVDGGFLLTSPYNGFWRFDQLSWLFPPDCGLFSAQYKIVHRGEPYEVIMSFSQLEFWKRVWIHQEIILAKRLYLLSPSHFILRSQCFRALTDINGYLEYIDDTTQDPMRRYKAKMYRNAFYRPFQIFRTFCCSKGIVGTPPPSDMWRLELYLSTNANATEELDYVYGLVSVTKSSIVPDYTKDFREVSLEFMAWTLHLWKKIHEKATKERWEDGLGDRWRFTISNIFNSHAVGVKRLHNLPSWAPVFLEADRRKRIARDSRKGRRFANSTIPELLTRLPIDILDDGLTLRIEGIKVQSVDYVYEETISFALLSSRLLKCINTFISRLWGKSSHGKSRLETLCCTLLGKETCDNHDSHLGFWLHHSRQGDVVSNGKWRKQQCLESYSNSVVFEWEVVAHRQNGGHHLFSTKDGYIGSMPDDVKPKDVVCVLAGFNELAVLRPEGDHYLFVGCCFMIGLMNGEVGELLKKGEVEIEKIDIR
ncbi:heterokaryon incompatibility het-6 [Fusarium napiforme]|uniref:Heterokaryon incompatibility het-6 n=1 Tax=Fusarium napiforme TaxID=42672 RepID=A0A8H5N0M4_9HYPO|nr:heterokaryon incompatibility het-6 [Fusarium napiforme]